MDDTVDIVSPPFLCEFVCEGYDICGAPAAITHHHRDGGVVPQALQGYGDYIGTPFYYQTHHRDSLTQA